MPAPIASLLPTWPAVKMTPFELAPDLLDTVDPGGIEQGPGRLGAHRRQAHQLDQVARVAAIRPERHPAHGRIVRRQAEHMAEVGIRPAPLRWPEQVGRLNQPADDPRRRTGRQVGEDPLRGPIAQDGGFLDDPRCAGRPAVGRLERSPRARFDRLARRGSIRDGRHRVPAATFALAPASRLSVFLAGASVPTSVSSSSPRMKASTRLNAMSSWIWTGGLFMK